MPVGLKEKFPHRLNRRQYFSKCLTLTSRDFTVQTLQLSQEDFSPGHVFLLEGVDRLRQTPHGGHVKSPSKEMIATANQNYNTMLDLWLHFKFTLKHVNKGLEGEVRGTTIFVPVWGGAPNGTGMHNIYSADIVSWLAKSGETDYECM